MKKLLVFAPAIVLAATLGCSGGGTVDPSAAAPTVTQEETTAEIENAMESSEMDASTYGKQ